MHQTLRKLTLGLVGVLSVGLLSAQLQPASDIDAPRSSKSYANAQQRVDELFVSDFSDGDQWTVTAITPDTAIWQITTDPEITGNFTDTEFESPTVANGFALHNFDGATVNGGGGDGRSVNFEQYLTSPSYDISSLDAGNTYQLDFYHSLRFCCSAVGDPRTPARVAFSYDGGQTFSDPVLVNSTLIPNDSYNEFESVRMPDGADTATQFQVRFIWDKAYYYWAVDDISISVLPSVEIELRENFYAIPPYRFIPQSQVTDSIRFLVDVLNNGADDATFNVVGQVFSLDNAGDFDELLYEDSLLYTGVVYDSLAENQAFNAAFPVPSDLGRYAVLYTYRNSDASADADANTENDSLRAFFEVTTDFYSKANGNVNGGRRSVDDDDMSVGYEAGNFYYIPNPDPDLFIQSVTFQGYNRGFTADNIDELELEFVVYGFTGDLDTNDMGVIGEELIELGLTSFQYDVSLLGADGDNTPITVEFEEDDRVFLNGDYPAYAVTVLYNDVDPEDGRNFFVGVGPEYVAYEFANPAGVLAPVNSLLRESFDEGVFDYDGIDGIAPNVGITLANITGTDEEQLSERQFAVSPNPANAVAQVRYDFGDATSATFEVVNGLGQTVRLVQEGNVAKGSFELPTADLANGLYYVKVRTASNHVATRKLTVQH